MGSRSRSAVAASVLVVAALTAGRLSSPGRAAPRVISEFSDGRFALSPAGRIAGRASCSGRACHGGLEAVAGGVRQNEFTFCLAHDKHARAFEVLKGERARRMAENLGIASAEKDARCLACHTTPQLAGPLAGPAVDLREDGVGCEACHGPAIGEKPWLTEHTLASWKGLSPDAKAEYGMTRLDDLAVQAKTCAGCHVGAPPDPNGLLPARDLNHDLMAAGHPRLTFELSSFRDNLPPHWRPDLHAGTPGYEAKVWAVGQAASAEASAALLEYRAKAASAPDSKAPWPEFAEAACFACHADLRSSSWRRDTGYYAGRRPGSIPYNRWYTALLPALEAVATGKAAAADRAVKELADEMEKPHPDPARVEKLAKAAVSQLGDLAVEANKPASYADATVKALAGRVAGRLESVKEPDWDVLTQAALAAAALRDAAGPGRAPEGPRALDGVFPGLAFPPSYESPQGYTPAAKADGQDDDLRARVLKALQQLAH